MWAGSHPTVTAEESAKECARGVRDSDLRQKILDACPEFAANSSKLQTAAANDKLHEVIDSDYSLSDLSRDDLLWLYRSQLARKNGPGHKIYDKIMVKAPFGLCVYCGQSAATTLDHFVPKTRVPGLSIDPWNLVPACFECNHGLLASFSQQATEQMLHPYFFPPIGRWLTASVKHIHPTVVQFAAIPDTSLSSELRARIQYQFDALGLGRRYRVLCGREISGLNRRLRDEFGDAAPAKVSAHLSEVALQAFATDENDRRAVMFEALAADRWYCAGGYVPPPLAATA